MGSFEKVTFNNIFAEVGVAARRRGSPRMDAQGQSNQAPYGPPLPSAFDSQWTHSHDCGHARCTPLTHPPHCPAGRIKLSHQSVLTNTGCCQELVLKDKHKCSRLVVQKKAGRYNSQVILAQNY